MNAPRPRPALALRRYAATQASEVHDFHQIVLGVEGSMEMAVDGRGARIDRSGAWIIPAGARHDYWAAGDNRQLVLDLPLASLAVPERFFEQARCIALHPSITRLVAGFAPGAGVGQSHECHRFAWQAAAHLCGALMHDAGNAAFPSKGLDFARIDAWLRRHLAEPLRIADLAAHCGFGMRRFHQLFNDAFGETPHRYVQRLRLDTALTRLADPLAALTDIALDCGFADQSTFTHAFTKRFGMAPGQWRAGSTRTH
ncbi:AraC family transcriptional regulator [Caballeronia sp. LZ033]|uniref:helix-turn-helix transcriptional regulator n=1 Tax=Caballeronia sp. LZ033 TaxID=3038566 RepID=UPI00286608D0|nr:AraC family transcriptional regulator [Caballeronia sp. LZ033]MDR5818482.1 AraC family transcriptional regulator [Caballeronia sp. LZ033]